MPLLPRLVAEANTLAKRYYYNSYGDCGYGYYYSGNYCYYSGWSYWGRWVLLAGIVVLAFAVFLFISCRQARRRRRYNQQPVYGTGWMAPGSHGAPQYEAPSGPPPGNHAGYYGNQDSGVTAPGNTYQPQRGGENVYAPPEGPPPSKY